MKITQSKKDLAAVILRLETELTDEKRHLAWNGMPEMIRLSISMKQRIDELEERVKEETIDQDRLLARADAAEAECRELREKLAAQCSNLTCEQCRTAKSDVLEIDLADARAEIERLSALELENLGLRGRVRQLEQPPIIGTSTTIPYTVSTMQLSAQPAQGEKPDENRRCFNCSNSELSPDEPVCLGCIRHGGTADNWTAKA